MTPALIAFNVVLVALLPIIWLLLRSARKSEARRRHTHAEGAVVAPVSTNEASRDKPAAPSTEDGSATEPEPAAGLNGHDAQTAAETAPAGAVLGAAASGTEAVDLEIDLDRREHGAMAARLVASLTATGYVVGPRTQTEVILTRGAGVVRIATDPERGTFTLLVSQSEAGPVLQGLLRSLVALEYHIRQTLDTEVILSRDIGDLARVRVETHTPAGPRAGSILGATDRASEPRPIHGLIEGSA